MSPVPNYEYTGARRVLGGGRCTCALRLLLITPAGGFSIERPRGGGGAKSVINNGHK